MKTYDFVVRLNGAVLAENANDAINKLNAHLDELGKIDSTAHLLSWDNVEWDLEQD